VIPESGLISRRGFLIGRKSGSPRALRRIASSVCSKLPGKACKGRLIQPGWNPRKTHGLTDLIQELGARGVDLDGYGETAAVPTCGYIADRKPGFSDEPIEMDSWRGHLKPTERLFHALSGRNRPPEKT
jgi:hypothetical protein